MSDPNKTLSDLHDQLATKLLDRVKSDDVSAADLNVARQFLKDNGIDAAPKKGQPLHSLADELPDFADSPHLN